MSVDLYTQKTFTVVRQIGNHLDTAPYYVKAVIRNAYSDEIIDTLELEDKGAQRFKKDWRVPADPSGEGFYISIVTSVYTDVGYTTKAEYADEENTYLVIDPPRRNQGGGGLARRDIRDIIQEEIEPIRGLVQELSKRKPEKPVKPKEYTMRWDEILTAIAGLQKTLKPEKPEKVNLGPVLQAVSEVKQAVKDKEVTPETNLSPVIEQLKRSVDTIMGMLEGVGEGLIKAAMEGIRDELGRVEWTSSFTTSAKKGEMPKVEREAPQQEEEIDIKSLAL